MSRVARAWRAWWPAALAWSVLWGGMVAVFVLADGADGGPRTRSLLYLAGSGLLGGYLLHLGRRAIVVAACIVLMAAAVTSQGLAWLEARSFSGSPERITRIGVTMRGPVQRFEGVVGGLRSWAYGGSADRSGAGADADARARSGADAHLVFEARAAVSATVGPWQATGGATIADATSHEDGVTVVTAPPGAVGTVRHFVVTDRPLAGRTFRVQVRVRSEDTADADGSPAVVAPRLSVGDQHGRYRAVVDMPLTEGWRGHEVVWTAPDDVPWTGLAIAVDKLRGTALQLSELRVQQRVDGAWSDLDGGSPRPVRLAARLAGTENSVEVVPSWTRYSVPGGQLPPGRVEVRMTVGSGHAVAVRDVQLVADGQGLRVRPLPSSRRVAFAGTHANLIAQSVAAVFLVLLVLARSVPLRLVMAVVTVAALWPLGSRAALIGVAVGFMLLLFERYRSRGPWLAVAASLTVAAVALGIAAGPSFARSSPGDVPGRAEIWRAAVDAYLTYPGEGVGTDFGAYWRQWSGQEAPVAHAHNLWLHFAASYGTPGLLAAVWLTLGSLLLAWRWGRWRGMALVLAVLAMNAVDVTLFFAGVLYPLSAGLNALRADSWRADATGARAGPSGRPGVSGTVAPPSTPRSDLRPGA